MFSSKLLKLTRIPLLEYIPYFLQALYLAESLKVRPAILTIDILYHSNITFPARP